jgi:hypothetical protein
MKLLIKLVIAALVINACWRASVVTLRYFQFKDECQQLALFGAQKSEADLQKRMVQTANDMGLPIAPENITVRRTENHTLVDATYTERVEIVPTYIYPYEFRLNLDVLTLGSAPTPR